MSQEDADRKRLIDDFVKSSPPPKPSPSEGLTDAIISDYVRWRAYGLSRGEAADKCKITQDQAMYIERAEDFIDMVDDCRESIKEDPESALMDLMPQAIGVLHSKLADGDVIAARELVRAAQMMSRSRSREEKEPETDANKRVGSTVEGRQKIKGAAKTIREASNTR